MTVSKSQPKPHVEVFVALLVAVILGGCRPGANPQSADGRVAVVATTNLVGDAVSIVGGEHVNVTALMGPGVDPHLYKAKEGDVTRMSRADVIFYGGLHLEGKMVELFEQMRERGRETIAVSDGVPREQLIEPESFGGNYDPHVWFDVALWKQVVHFLGEELARIDEEHADEYRMRAEDYTVQLDSLDAWMKETLSGVPATARVLITSHDAFGYFGRAYGLEVRGLQGISTVSEAGTADVQQLAEMVAERRIPALFVESSVSPRGIEAVRAAVRSRGFEVEIGGSLFSDALGDTDTPEGTYLGMVRHNVRTIANGLTAGD